jgi:hypothetical protein
MTTGRRLRPELWLIAGPNGASAKRLYCRYPVALPPWAGSLIAALPSAAQYSDAARVPTLG